MKNIVDISHKAVWGIAAAYVGGMLVFAVFALVARHYPLNKDQTIKPLYSSASGNPKFIGPPVCEPSVGDPRCKTGLSEYGMLDGVSPSLITGWVFSQNANHGDARVVVSFTSTENEKLQYTQTVSVSLDRPDIAEYLKTQFPKLNVSAPLGFAIKPGEVIGTPGTYKISAVEQGSGLKLEVASPLSTVTIGAK